jgi:hypothetical protein
MHKDNTFNNTRSEYSYNDTKGPNRLSEYVSYFNNYSFESQVFQQFHLDGALYLKTDYIKIPSVNDNLYSVKVEEFFYNYLNHTNKYIFKKDLVFEIYPDIYLSTPITEWRYRFNPFGEREQKRMYNSPLGDMGQEMYPWVYYQLGIDNRQYAVYYGAQSDEFQINATAPRYYVVKPDPYRQTAFFYPTEYNVYGNESGPKLTYKYVGGIWQKQFKIYDYLGSLRYTVAQTGTVLNYKQYEPYGAEILDTKYCSYNHNWEAI